MRCPNHPPALFRAIALSLLLLVTLPRTSGAAEPAPAPWKAGCASVKITPETMMAMAGYASRKKPAEGVAQDLFAKALVLEDDHGKRVAIVTLDLVGVPRALRDLLVPKLSAKYHLPPESLLLNVSHTHCGPVVKQVDEAMLSTENEQVKQSHDYFEKLQTNILAAVGQAVEQLAPAKVDYLHARAGFAMNRRRPTPSGVINAPYSDGPVDHDVPVLRVNDGTGKKTLALLFGYACHNTTLGFSQFCGDYAGFAQQYLEQAHPGTVALFMTGCGGDQNPYPRGTIELCRQHGRSLATAVDAALETVPRSLSGPLNVKWAEVDLEFAPAPSREELMKLQSSRNEIEKRHATILLEKLEKAGKIDLTYSYPIQTVQFGNDLTLVALAGETVVDFSLRLKRELPGLVWVAGYSNDVFGYVPSRRVLGEGGYEAGGAMLYTAFPGAFAPSVEDRIVNKVLDMAGKRRGE